VILLTAVAALLTTTTSTTNSSSPIARLVALSGKSQPAEVSSLISSVWKSSDGSNWDAEKIGRAIAGCSVKEVNTKQFAPASAVFWVCTYNKVDGTLLPETGFIGIMKEDRDKLSIGQFAPITYKGYRGPVVVSPPSGARKGFADPKTYYWRSKYIVESALAGDDATVARLSLDSAQVYVSTAPGLRPPPVKLNGAQLRELFVGCNRDGTNEVDSSGAMITFVCSNPRLKGPYKVDFEYKGEQLFQIFVMTPGDHAGQASEEKPNG